MKMPTIYLLLCLFGHLPALIISTTETVEPTGVTTEASTANQNEGTVSYASSTDSSSTESAIHMTTKGIPGVGTPDYSDTAAPENGTESANRTTKCPPTVCTPTSTGATTSIAPTSASTTSRTSAQATTAATAGGSDTTGYIILMVLLLAIIILVAVIYFMRKKSRRYSFDLNPKCGEESNIPLNNMEQEGTFQPASKDDDKPPATECVQENQVISKDTNSVPKGSTSEVAADGENGGIEPEKPPSEDSFSSQVPLSPKDEPGTFTLDLHDLDPNPSNRTSMETLDELQNENNNNGIGSHAADRVDPGKETSQAIPNGEFIEICLDEPK
ncbi:uncharacterized protein LOC118793682 [Megalops cyprinoides]|uniref:uncharacterized protein LOC118793682 n=1 Tax=Megalops cyprinoides TaxID=118141 RepID=UPI00186405CD|nr:uncharacterized protein LOC118793682 [Megalops cyprinoides]